MVAMVTLLGLWLMSGLVSRFRAQRRRVHIHGEDVSLHTYQ